VPNRASIITSPQVEGVEVQRIPCGLFYSVVETVSKHRGSLSVTGITGRCSRNEEAAPTLW